MKSAFGLLLVAGLLAGCGSQSGSSSSVNAKFDKVDYEMASIEEGETTGAHLERLTQRYIELVRKYADQLGADEARKRLEDKAFELSAYCLPCVTMLDREVEKY